MKGFVSACWIGVSAVEGNGLSRLPDSRGGAQAVQTDKTV
jgi:hypothetical protein